MIIIIIIIIIIIKTAASTTNWDIKKKVFCSGMTTFIFSHKDLNGTMKMVKPLEDAGLLIKSISKIVENELKEQKG